MIVFSHVFLFFIYVYFLKRVPFISFADDKRLFGKMISIATRTLDMRKKNMYRLEKYIALYLDNKFLCSLTNYFYLLNELHSS